MNEGGTQWVYIKTCISEKWVSQWLNRHRGSWAQPQQRPPAREWIGLTLTLNHEVNLEVNPTRVNPGWASEWIVLEALERSLSSDNLWESEKRNGSHTQTHNTNNTTQHTTRQEQHHKRPHEEPRPGTWQGSKVDRRQCVPPNGYMSKLMEWMCCEQHRPRTTRRAPHIYPDIWGDGFQYHSSQLTFSDEWYCPQTMHPQDVGSTPGLSHSHRQVLTEGHNQHICVSESVGESVSRSRRRPRGAWARPLQRPPMGESGCKPSNPEKGWRGVSG